MKQATFTWHRVFVLGLTLLHFSPLIQAAELRQEPPNIVFLLVDDLGERSDLSQQRPQLTSELRAQLRRWQTETGARMPELNPDFDPSSP